MSDGELSAGVGYPVGDLDGVKIMFLHYETFEEAEQAWQRRVARIDFGKLLFVCTARDDLSKVSSGESGHFETRHLEQFRRMAYPRLLLTNSLGKDEPFAVVPARDRVEDLHSWLPLARTLSGKRLRKSPSRFRDRTAATAPTKIAAARGAHERSVAA